MNSVAGVLIRSRWWAVVVCVIAALIVHQQSSAAGWLAVGLPLWVLLFLAVQVGLTIAAAWLARS